MRYVLVLLSMIVSAAHSEVVKLKYDPQFILETIAKRKKIQLDPSFPIPKIYFESITSLKQFQDAIEPQWGIRPGVITNAYVWSRNEIYLIDDGKYYKNGRKIDDSLAHELVHFLQVKYQNYDLNQDESAEWEAIDVQTWFRPFNP